MTEVVVIGEALVDVVQREGRSHTRPGGAPLNVAVGLGRLGRRTRLICALGHDDEGQLVREHALASGVSLTATPLDRTSVARAEIGADGSATYQFALEWDIPVPVTPQDTQFLHVGSVAAVLGPGSAAVAAAVARRSPTTRLSIDPNVRPAVMGQRQAALEALESLLAQADVVKLSDEDAAWIYPGLDADGVLDRLLGARASIAVLTSGSHGCRIASPRHRRDVPAERVAVVDTVGAGDSFTAALLHAVLSSDLPLDEYGPDELERAARYAAACAAITTSRPGADPPWSHEVLAEQPWGER